MFARNAATSLLVLLAFLANFTSHERVAHAAQSHNSRVIRDNYIPEASMYRPYKTALETLDDNPMFADSMKASESKLRNEQRCNTTDCTLANAQQVFRTTGNVVT